MRLISKKSVLRILQEEPSYYDTQNAITEIYDKINELPTIDERKTMTHEEAVGFLQESGWLQDHDKQIYEQGKRDGIEERKTGRWIDVGGARGLIPSNDFKCSICGNILDFNGVNAGRGDANYCPNCGAKMKGAEE